MPKDLVPILSTPEAIDDWVVSAIVSPAMQDDAISDRVQAILERVATDGDVALEAIVQEVGDTIPDSAMFEGFRLREGAIDGLVDTVPEETKTLLNRAAGNIRQFAEAVVANCAQPVELTQPWGCVGLRWQPVDNCLCYVPGGRYPLPSTALMTALSAQAAGVLDISLCSPKLTPEVIYAGTLAGVTSFHQLGGAQAIAAFAYGTASIAPVSMIVGPGNAWVTEAKRQLQGRVGIDMLAGPSEVAILADNTANPQWVALDLLAQAEHDPGARVVLFTNDMKLLQAVAEAIPQEIARLRLPDWIEKSLANSALCLVEDLEDAVPYLDQLAPEHLQVMTDEPEAWLDELSHFGAAFLGHGGCVALGDYLAGPNHTLPTASTARFASGLTPLRFLRSQSFIQPEPDTMAALATDTGNFADLEGLRAHAASARARM